MTRCPLHTIATTLMPLTLTCGLMACGGNNERSSNNDSMSNTSANNTTMGETTNNATTMQTPGDPPEMYESEYQLRFDSMRFVNFDSMSVAIFRLLNNLIRDNLDQGLDFPIVVLIDLQSIDAEAGTAQLRAGSGLKTTTEGEYEWDPEAPEVYNDATLDAETGAIRGDIPDFVFVTTVESSQGTTTVDIPINDLEFTGTLTSREQDPETVEILDGNIKGYITQEQADAVEIAVSPTSDPISLTSLLNTETINFDSDGDGTDDVWTLEADFTAIPTVID